MWGVTRRPPSFGKQPALVFPRTEELAHVQCCSFSHVPERGPKRAPSSRTGLPPRPERCAGLECGCPDKYMANMRHHVRKPVAWPGQEKISDRTKNCVTKVPGYIVYSVVSNTHDRTNVPLCSGSHKITCSHSLCDSIGAALVPSSCRSAHSAPLHRKQFYCKCGSLTTLSSR